MKYPDIITKLAEIKNLPPGVNGFLLQGLENQLVFFEFKKETIIPPHSHAAQWGIVVDGEIRLNINGEENIFRKGDSYFIPANVEHSGITTAEFKAIDYFDQSDRYKI